MTIYNQIHHNVKIQTIQWKELQTTVHGVINTFSWKSLDTRTVNRLYVQEEKGDGGDKEIEEKIFTVDKLTGFLKKCGCQSSLVKESCC